MDRILSEEERIRRAEEVAARRKNKELELNYDNIYLEKNKSKSRKILMQILVCLLIYCGLYYIKNLPEENNIKIQYNEKINWILNYDIDLKKIYNNLFNKKENIKDIINESIINNDEKLKIDNEIEKDNIIEENNISMYDLTFKFGIGGELENNNEEVNNEVDNDVNYIKENINMCNPLENGIITSRFGSREGSETVSPNHKGIDLGAVSGTEIKSASDGKVIEVSSSGDFGKHIKIQNGDVTFIYAHCSKLLVNKGDEINMGQKIAEVGSTGKATGPHLHFEIRRKERSIDPESIMNFEN